MVFVWVFLVVMAFVVGRFWWWWWVWGLFLIDSGIPSELQILTCSCILCVYFILK